MSCLKEKVIFPIFLVFITFNSVSQNTPISGLPYFIEFSHHPQTEDQLHTWVQKTKDCIQEINKNLDKTPLIIDNNTTDKANRFFTSFYYDVVFKNDASNAPIKKHYPFIGDRKQFSGGVSIYIQDFLQKETFSKLIKDRLYGRGIAVQIHPYHPLYAIQDFSLYPESFSHCAFTLDKLEKMKSGKLITDYESQIEEISKQLKIKPYLTRLKNRLNILLKIVALLKKIKPFVLWHLEIPTTGIFQGETFGTYSYPFLPHLFSLWQMAPTLGKGVDIVFIDSGIAAFSIKENKVFKKNLNLSMNADFSLSSYNVANDGNVDKIERFLNMIKKYLNPAQEQNYSYNTLERKAKEWIHEYLEYQTLNGISQWLKKYGKKELFLNDGEFSEEGTRALRAIEINSEGLCPKGKETNFSTISVLEEENQNIYLLEALPTASITSDRSAISIGHGSHVSGIAAGNLYMHAPYAYPKNLQDFKGICGIAPDANIMMIKAFNDKERGSMQSFINAVKKSVSFNAPILNMSLKLADYLDPHSQISKNLKTLLAVIPYPICASGNDCDFIQQKETTNFVSYPARFEFIPFDVGAFAYNPETKTFPIALFSQFQETIGPKFVAPGHNILSCGLIPNQEEDSLYMFMDGTSMATPIMSGFVALMLAEFQNDFTREELLKTCYASSIKMHHNEYGWNERTLLGVLDMRTVLFTLHTIRKLKKNIVATQYSFETLLDAVHSCLFGMIDEYSRKFLNNISFKKNFMPFFQAAQKKNYNPVNSFSTLDKAVCFTVDTILHCINNKTYSKPKEISDNVINNIEINLKSKKKSASIFSPTTQKRIEAVFSVKQTVHRSFMEDRKKYFKTLTLSSFDIQKLIESTYQTEYYWKKQINSL